MLLDRNAASLHDIAAACRKIGTFLAGMDRGAFRADEKTQSAVIHQILTIGEAAKRLSGEFREQHSEVPWALLARTRDILIHHYEGVDVEEVWRIAEADIPSLLASVASLLSPEESGPQERGR